jgi:exodeoxyribonuclease VII small subunit
MTPPAEDDITGMTYEAALAELDTLITKLEGGSIALEEAIGAYERGAVLAKHCSDLLERTEQRVKQLVVSANGDIGERPLEIAESAVDIRPALMVHPPVRNAPSRIDPDDVPF